MGRFLIFFSYFGTRYRGLQKQTNVVVRGKTIHTIEGVLQEAVRNLRPANDFRIVLSSRTDKGVHAIKNACHVDLAYPYEGQEYNPEIITNVLNYHLKKREEDVRVLETRRVPDTFHSRFHAKGRKYVYRLGHMIKSRKDMDSCTTESENEEFLKELRKFSPSKQRYRRLPIGDSVTPFEAWRSVVKRGTLDISKLMKAAEVVSGIHNFSSFTVRQKITGDYVPHPVKMLTIGIKRGQPLGHQYQKLSHDVTRNVEFWDIHVQSSSFLYRQVRRLVGTMVLVAKNSISLSDMQDILDNPRKEFPFSSLMGMNESGLYLVDVLYDEKALEFDETEAASSSSSKSPTDKESFHDSQSLDDDKDDVDVEDTFSMQEDISVGNEDRNTNLHEKSADVVGVQGER